MSFTPPTPNWIGSLGISALTEIAESGQYVLAYGYKWTQKLEGSYDHIITVANTHAFDRGTIGGPDNNWIINESRISRTPGGKGHIEIDWQNIGSYINTDEWSCPPEDLAPRIERHPLFASLTQNDFIQIQAALLSTTNGGIAAAMNKIPNTSNPTLAAKLYNKMRLGFETYYLFGARYTWTSYYLPGTLPTPSEAGFTQTPGGPGILPENFQWLRLADDPGLAEWSPVGGVLRLTRSWLGAPLGWWDADIYLPG